MTTVDIIQLMKNKDDKRLFQYLVLCLLLRDL